MFLRHCTNNSSVFYFKPFKTSFPLHYSSVLPIQLPIGSSSSNTSSPFIFVHTIKPNIREMGFAKEEKTRSRIWRGVKTVFFLITMLISFLLFSAPVLLVIADTLVPFSLLSASSSSLSLKNLSSYFNNYDFRYSLIDIPLVSILRSAVILCVYSLCDGPSLSKGPYLGITTLCSVVSSIYVTLKAAFVFGDRNLDRGGGYVRGMEIALFVCSLVLAIGHIVVAYRTNCRARRKLLVYKIDVEAVSACKNAFPPYQKIPLKARETLFLLTTKD